MSVDNPAKSLTQATYERLRRDVLSCALAPGSRVNVKELAELYEASGGAVREALSRLTSEDLVVLEPQKGFRIAPISLADLRDLTLARIEIEGMCLRQSIENGDVSWEARLVSAYHSLSRAPGPESGDKYESVQWNGAHSAFHETLVSACPNSWLSRLRKMMFEQNSRYRALSVAITAGDRDLSGEHKGLLDAALARDADTAVALIGLHIQQTSAVLMTELQASKALGDQ
ncbi:GntR family transcriptional regulator [Pseudomonas parafulva]|uniref:GntR family transcriptional regulator n=1 Tax=Pseudomonas parafulva TaxID=157782 RepID=UPI000540843A|nr:GntR family transcriptional regulator [Pseudomonas parafulva]AIZ35427.1 transcriptional regulator [Pseudomonas parafulva]